MRTSAGEHPLAAGDELTTVGLSLVQRARVALVGRLVHERADEGAIGQWRANGQRLVGGLDLRDELVGDRGVRDDPTQGGAALPGGAGGGEHDGAHGQIEVGRRRDDRRVVAAEFEQQATEATGDPRCHRAAHAR